MRQENGEIMQWVHLGDALREEALACTGDINAAYMAVHLTLREAFVAAGDDAVPSPSPTVLLSRVRAHSRPRGGLANHA